jgi:hypothetical protein
MPRIAAALVAAFLLAESAAAHDWYEPMCCNEKDCEPLPDSAVTQVREGYRVRYAGKRGLAVDVIVPWSKARPSQDHQFHGCASPVRFFCLYVPFNV